MLCIIFYFYSFCTVHWADLSWPPFHYWLYPVWLCMWQINKNLEPWTLNLIGRKPVVQCEIRHWAPPYGQNGMLITPREYLTVRLVVESDSSYQSIESSTIRGHPYCFYCIFDQINAALVSIRDSYQKHLKKIPLPPHCNLFRLCVTFYWQKNRKRTGTDV